MTQMERYTMFLDWMNQQCQNDYTNQGNLKIQCNPYQITNGIFLKKSEMWKWKSLGLVNSLWPHELYTPWNCQGHNTGVGGLSLLQGIFPIQGSNPGLPHCRWILYQLSHKGRTGIPEWVDYPFSSGFAQPRDQTRVSCITYEFFINWGKT